MILVTSPFIGFQCILFKNLSAKVARKIGCLVAIRIGISKFILTKFWRGWWNFEALLLSSGNQEVR